MAMHELFPENSHFRTLCTVVGSNATMISDYQGKGKFGG